MPTGRLTFRELVQDAVRTVKRDFDPSEHATAEAARAVFVSRVVYHYNDMCGDRFHDIDWDTIPQPDEKAVRRRAATVFADDHADAVWKPSDRTDGEGVTGP